MRLKVLIVIYIGFISLGLPDAVLGVAWPGMRLELQATLSWGGFLAGLTTVVSVLASLAAIRVMKHLSTGIILAVCALTTSAAMLGYSLAPCLTAIAAFTILFGIGQGAVDTAVNAYVARHYSSRHMNWVHGFWGLGATGGTLIFAAAFSFGQSWRIGYISLFIVQLILGCFFLATMKWWKCLSESDKNCKKHFKEKEEASYEMRRAVSGVFFYFFYPGLEVVTGLWGASYLIETTGLEPKYAGAALALYWGSLTLGRFAIGFAAESFQNTALTRAGLALASFGVLLAYLSASPHIFILALGNIGLGLSTLYPSMMHETSRRCGLNRLEKIISWQVGAALAGAAILPALAGLFLRNYGLEKLPGFLVLMMLFLIAAHEFSTERQKPHK